MMISRVDDALIIICSNKTINFKLIEPIIYIFLNLTLYNYYSHGIKEKIYTYSRRPNGNFPKI